MNRKQVVRLTESDIRRIVNESVNRMLSEEYEVDNLDGEIMNHIKSAYDLSKELVKISKGNETSLEWAVYLNKQLAMLLSGSVPMSRR